MSKLRCHCEDSKQMGKGQGFFVAKSVSIATAICAHYPRASFVWLWWLIRGGWLIPWLWVVYFCFTFPLALRTMVIG